LAIEVLRFVGSFVSAGEKCALITTGITIHAVALVILFFLFLFFSVFETPAALVCAFAAVILDIIRSRLEIVLQVGHIFGRRVTRPALASRSTQIEGSVRDGLRAVGAIIKVRIAFVVVVL
jgi:hypothetical protein